ncbi:hypothetical protein B0H10DRAFT_1949460 [Mycena sp. CBHHK59/15]|nr:hypothetical protein B0H10DRAFT_1949460 [Mycena sp. CBHHK59/15]
MSTAHLESVQNLLLAVQAHHAASGLDSLPGSDNADPFPSSLVPQRCSQEDDNDEDDPVGMCGGAAGPHTPAGKFDEILFTLEAGWVYKKQNKLWPESDLVCKEFLKDVDGKTWVMPVALKKTAADYAHAAALSQLARTYHGKSLAAAVMKCIARSKTKATAALYRRMVWLVNVEKGLDELHKAFPDKVDLDCAFNMIYDVNIQLYGPPDSKIWVTVANKVDGWLNTLDKETSLAAN